MIPLVILVVGVTVAYAQDAGHRQGIDYSAEFLAMIKAAGVVGTFVLLAILRDARNQHAKEKADLVTRYEAALEKSRKETEERNEELKGWRERSLTALINFDKTMEDQVQVNKKMVESIGTLITWLRHRENMPPAE